MKKIFLIGLLLTLGAVGPLQCSNASFVEASQESPEHQKADNEWAKAGADIHNKFVDSWLEWAKTTAPDQTTEPTIDLQKISSELFQSEIEKKMSSNDNDWYSKLDEHNHVQAFRSKNGTVVVDVVLPNGSRYTGQVKGIEKLSDVSDVTKLIKHGWGTFTDILGNSCDGLWEDNKPAKGFEFMKTYKMPLGRTDLYIGELVGPAKFGLPYNGLQKFYENGEFYVRDGFGKMYTVKYHNVGTYSYKFLDNDFKKEGEPEMILKLREKLLSGKLSNLYISPKKDNSCTIPKEDGKYKKSYIGLYACNKDDEFRTYHTRDAAIISGPWTMDMPDGFSTLQTYVPRLEISYHSPLDDCLNCNGIVGYNYWFPNKECVESVTWMANEPVKKEDYPRDYLSVWKIKEGKIKIARGSGSDNAKRDEVGREKLTHDILLRPVQRLTRLGNEDCTLLGWHLKDLKNRLRELWKALEQEYTFSGTGGKAVGTLNQNKTQGDKGLDTDKTDETTDSEETARIEMIQQKRTFLNCFTRTTLFDKKGAADVTRDFEFVINRMKNILQYNLKVDTSNMSTDDIASNYQKVVKKKIRELLKVEDDADIETMVKTYDSMLTRSIPEKEDMTGKMLKDLPETEFGRACQLLGLLEGSDLVWMLIIRHCPRDVTAWVETYSMTATLDNELFPQLKKTKYIIYRDGHFYQGGDSIQVDKKISIWDKVEEIRVNARWNGVRVWWDDDDVE